MSSSAEAETCGNFNNRKIAIGMQPSLITLDQKQPAITFKTDNSTIEGFVNLGMKPKRSKTWYMKWQWLKDKSVLYQPRVYWGKGMKNEADYFTKHHLPITHCQMRPRYIHTSNLVRKISQTIRLCKGTLNRVLGNTYCIESLKVIRAKTQSMTEKCHTVRRLNRPRQHIM